MNCYLETVNCYRFFGCCVLSVLSPIASGISKSARQENPAKLLCRVACLLYFILSPYISCEHFQGWRISIKPRICSGSISRKTSDKDKFSNADIAIGM